MCVRQLISSTPCSVRLVLVFTSKPKSPLPPRPVAWVADSSPDSHGYLTDRIPDAPADNTIASLLSCSMGCRERILVFFGCILTLVPKVVRG